MSRLGRLLGRLPILGRCFASPSSPSSSPSRSSPPHSPPSVPLPVPHVVCRSPAVLSGTELIRSFGVGESRSYALRGVTAEFRKGELNLLMGPSGSGKSTLLAVLSGLLRPDSGSVGALGHDLWGMTEDQLERFRLRHCSYIFQGYNLFPALTAREQLEIVLTWGEGCSGREARRRADHVLGRLGLSGKAHLRPIELSGGEKQRVAIARALVKNPALIFADEPTAALDWENGQQVARLLTESARERGAMVLMVTHDPRLLSFADRVYELEDGRLTRSEPCPRQPGGSERGVAEHALSSPSPPLPVRKGPRLQLSAARQPVSV